MDTISLVGIEAFGTHGVLEHERAHGQRFVVDVALDLDTSAAAASDDLADTVDYGSLSGDIAALIAGEPVALLETLADAIARRCLREPRVEAVEVTVHKPGAPVPTLVSDVAVTRRRGRG